MTLTIALGMKIDGNLFKAISDVNGWFNSGITTRGRGALQELKVIHCTHDRSEGLCLLLWLTIVCSIMHMERLTVPL